MTPNDTVAALAVVTVLIAMLIPLVISRKKTGIVPLGGLSLYNAYKFMTHRYDFMQSKFGEARLFQFYFMNHHVVAMSGPAARKVFFNRKDLSFSQGYATLNFGAPEITKDSHGDQASEDHDLHIFGKRLQLLLSNSRVSALLPSLLKDIHAQMSHLGSSGQFDPFNEIYKTVFRMTVRMGSCRSLIEDDFHVNMLHDLYASLEDACTPLSIIAPWLPIWGSQARNKIINKMSALIHKFVAERRKAEVLGEDAIDVLVRDGLDDVGIINFVMRLIFAGIINTGMNACWILLLLGQNTSWKNKVVLEVFQVISQHATLPDTSPLHQRLASIPVDAWENSMPLLDIVIREDLRLISAHMTGLRKNGSKDLLVDHQVVPKNTFLAYSFADAHLNPEIYPEPQKFDPDRFSDARSEDKTASNAFLAWGSGRHPCLGKRVAKLELKIIVAYMLAGYEFEVVDKKGAPLTHVLLPTYNSLAVVRPIGGAFLKYTVNPAVVM